MIDGTLDAGFENIVMLMRQLGRDHLRPAGLESEKTGLPVPPDHSVFVAFNQMGLRFGMRPNKRKKGESDGPREPSRSARTAILAAEEMAFWDQGVCMSLPGPGLGGPPIGLLGTPEQKEKFLKAPFRGTTPRWGCYALTEPGAGSDVARIAATARKDGDHWVLNGAKTFITNGARAEWAVVFATVDKEAGRAGQRAFIVEKGTPGFECSGVEKKMGLTASETAGLVFEDCRIPLDNLLGGEEGKSGKAGFKVAMSTFDMTRPMVAMMAVGIGRCAWERAQEVAKQAFSAHPTPAEAGALDKLAEARRRLDAARLICWRAAWKMDVHEGNTVEASMAKIYAPPAGLFAAQVALDVAALAGVPDEPLIDKCFRDLKVFDIFEGAGEVQRIVLARRLFDYPRG